MSIVHALPNWPKSPTTRSVDRAAQVQYYAQAQPNDPEEKVSVIAINLWDVKFEPYQWRVIPLYLKRIFMIIAWMQWVASSCYLTRKEETLPIRSLIKSYVIYMERLLDNLWHALDSGDVKKWEETDGSLWVQIQKHGKGFHSHAYLEKVLEVGIIKRTDLTIVIRNWDEEADVIKKLGFPGSDKYESVGGCFNKVDTPDWNDILEKYIEHLKKEEKGEYLWL